MKKILVSGVASGIGIFIVQIVLSRGFNVIFPPLAAQYNNIGLFRPSTDPLMLLYFVYPFVLGLILAWFWGIVKGIFGSYGFLKGGIYFGFVFWVIASIPGMFITYSSFQVSALMVVTWSLSGLVGAVGAGLILAKLNPVDRSDKIVET